MTPLTIDCIEDGTVTAVKIWARIGLYVLVGVGTARRHPDDRPDYDVGQALALSRALRDLHRKVRDLGYGLAYDRT